MLNGILTDIISGIDLLKQNQDKSYDDSFGLSNKLFNAKYFDSNNSSILEEKDIKQNSNDKSIASTKSNDKSCKSNEKSIVYHLHQDLKLIKNLSEKKFGPIKIENE